jgi:hypothetical protein
MELGWSVVWAWATPSGVPDQEASLIDGLRFGFSSDVKNSSYSLSLLSIAMVGSTPEMAVTRLLPLSRVPDGKSWSFRNFALHDAHLFGDALPAYRLH